MKEAMAAYAACEEQRKVKPYIVKNKGGNLTPKLVRSSRHI